MRRPRAPQTQTPDGADAALPPLFETWFAKRGWSPRTHQLEALRCGLAGRSFLLIAPTGGGKTLAGFLPSLVDLAECEGGRGEGQGVHTLYVSPLKALAVDIARNLSTPVAEMGLDLRIETRTGDTPPAKRRRQQHSPPDILLTTPEQIALMISHPGAEKQFRGLKAIIVDELHALAGGKRGHLLALGFERLKKLAPGLRVVGLSATVAEPQDLLDWIGGAGPKPDFIRAAAGAAPEVSILDSDKCVPWAGHSARHAWPEIYAAIKAARMTLVFVNTRSQAEMTFQALWRLNDDNLPIALHHGSLDVERRRKVEAAMAGGGLRAVVCTSTLDLGVDWGDVDLVIQIGAPKGASRITQRIGRANHRLDEPSRALLVPGNRFEVLECLAARDAIAEGALDGEPLRRGALDVLAQHILCVACARPVRKDDLYAEVTGAAPYRALDRPTFDDAFAFVENGGYAMQKYDRFRKIVPTQDGAYRVRNAAVASAYRLNAGVIVESPALYVRLRAGAGPLRGGRSLGTLEEWYVEGLVAGDTFLFAGEVLRFEGVAGDAVIVTRASGEDPKTPMWGGGRFPLSTYLADRVRRMIDTPADWARLPDAIREWLEIQRDVSVIPHKDELLVETFPHGGRSFLVAYPFDGRLAHQTLGTLLTRRLERAGLQPIGFVAGEYALSVWARKDLSGVDMDALFAEDMLGDDLESWLAESVMMKRTFRNCAVIAGLIERRPPGAAAKTGRQVTFSADLIHDVLKAYEPQHILLRAAWEDAAGGYLDLKRLSDLLARIRGRIRHQRLAQVSPLAVPVMLEISRDPVEGEAREAALADAQVADAQVIDEAKLVAEAMGDVETRRRGGRDPRQRRMPRRARVRRAPLA